MFTHRILLLKKTKALFAFKTLTFKNDFSLTNVYCDNFKEKESNTSTSIIQIKKSMKLYNIKYQEGVTNLKTNCPACEYGVNDELAIKKDIYINKTTGKIANFISIIRLYLKFIYGL